MAKKAPKTERAPHLFVEPPIPVASEFSHVEHVRAVIHQLDTGNMRMPALLTERMLWNPRLRGVIDTRLAGLISTTLTFEPSRNNRDARRAAKEFAEDWPLMAPAPMRKQMLRWALFLGFGLGQRPVDESSTTGRTIFKLRPYWPGFAYWYWAEKAYRITTFDRGATGVRAPSIEGTVPMVSPTLSGAPSAADSSWVISEPFGVNSFRDGLIHAAWRPWLGHEWATRDQARSSEKYGIGVIKAKYPRGTGDEHKAAIRDFTHGLRTMGSEGVIPCEQRGGDDGPDQKSFDVEPFEFNGQGFQAIGDTMNANAVALAILFLGHNLTTEIKGGGSYAAAGIGDLIRDDKKYDDAEIEASYARPQLAAQWAEANYGDPGLAPIFRYATDSPSINLQRAQMVNQLAMATAQLRANVPRVDLVRLAEEFRLPMLADSVQVAVPDDISSAPLAVPVEKNPSDPVEPKEEDQP